MAVHEVEGLFLRQCLAGREHVLVHLLHPREEAVEVARPPRLGHAVHRHPPLPRTAGHIQLGLAARRAAREHVHAHALAHEALRQLAHVARQAALDHRRVLPGEHQHALAHGSRPYLPHANDERCGAYS